MITKNKLKGEVVRLTYRVNELEEILCPCESHDWQLLEKDIEPIDAFSYIKKCRYKCSKCKKEKTERIYC